MVAVAEVGKQTREVDATCRAQLGDDALIVALLGGQVLHLVRHILALGRGDIVGEVAEVPPTVGAIIGVGARTYSYIRDALPVAAVVARVVAGQGKVGCA